MEANASVTRTASAQRAADVPTVLAKVPLVASASATRAALAPRVHVDVPRARVNARHPLVVNASATRIASAPRTVVAAPVPLTTAPVAAAALAIKRDSSSLWALSPSCEPQRLVSFVEPTLLLFHFFFPLLTCLQCLLCKYLFFNFVTTSRVLSASPGLSALTSWPNQSQPFVR